MSTIDPLGLLERWFWVVADTEMDRFRDCVRLGGDPTGTATLGVSPFGLVEECIGDLASISLLPVPMDIAGDELQSSRCSLRIDVEDDASACIA
jgi:hypothetical protein